MEEEDNSKDSRRRDRDSRVGSGFDCNDDAKDFNCETRGEDLSSPDADIRRYAESGRREELDVERVERRSPGKADGRE